MRALSIRQPWAWAITYGWKPVENRKWSTRYRGPVAIHAGLREETEAVAWVVEAVARQTGISADTVEMMYATRRALGCYVGYGVITDCVTSSDSPWFFGPVGIVIEEAVAFRSRPHPGRLGIYTVPVTTAVEIRALLAAAA